MSTMLANEITHNLEGDHYDPIAQQRGYRCRLSVLIAKALGDC